MEYFQLVQLNLEWQKACTSEEDRVRIKNFYKTPDFFDLHKEWTFHLGTCTADNRRFILFTREQHNLLKPEVETLLQHTPKPLPTLWPQFVYGDVSTVTIPDRNTYHATTKQLAKNNQFYKVEQRKQHYQQLLQTARQLRMEKTHRFMTIDVEVWERDHTRVLEVGWSIYDSCKELHLDVHCAVKEFAHLRNGRYVPDHRNNFLFGTTKWCTLKEAVEDLQKDLDDDPHTPLVLIGHDLKEDVKYVTEVGIKLPPTVIKYDTTELWLSKGHAQKMNLGKVLETMGLESFCLHNAGNDAHYTMEVFLGMTSD
jgi:hypothetical protein